MLRFLFHGGDQRMLRFLFHGGDQRMLRFCSMGEDRGCFAFVAWEKGNQKLIASRLEHHFRYAMAHLEHGSPVGEGLGVRGCTLS